MEKLRHELGSIICNALDDKEVIEIMVNPDGYIWLDRLSYGMENTGKKISPERLLAALGTIAAMLRTELNKNSPILEGELPLDGSRVEGVIPPVVKSASMSIRKHSSAVFPIERYIEEGRISKTGWGFLQDAIETRKNILIAGGTGSGKTTFVNAILDALAKLREDDRVLILEDTVELKLSLLSSRSISMDIKWLSRPSSRPR